MYHEEIQVKFKYGCNPVIIGEVIALGFRELFENLVYRCIMKRCRSSSNMGVVRLLLEKLLPSVLPRHFSPHVARDIRSFEKRKCDIP
jgi:hypothetical protein